MFRFILILMYILVFSSHKILYDFTKFVIQCTIHMKHYFFVILNLTAPVLMHFHYIEKSGKVWLDKPNTFFFTFLRYLFVLLVIVILMEIQYIKFVAISESKILFMVKHQYLFICFCFFITIFESKAILMVKINNTNYFLFFIYCKERIKGYIHGKK